MTDKAKASSRVSAVRLRPPASGRRLNKRTGLGLGLAVRGTSSTCITATSSRRASLGHGVRFTVTLLALRAAARARLTCAITRPARDARSRRRSPPLSPSDAHGDRRTGNSSRTRTRYSSTIAQRHVHAGKRLVEQQYLGIGEQRACECDAFALAAAERLHVAVEERREFQHVGNTRRGGASA